MNRLRYTKRAPRLFLVALSSLCALLPLYAQQPETTASSVETTRAIELYLEGHTKEAIEALRKVTKADKRDALAWHYLGLALARDAQEKEARKAFETAVRLKPDFAAARVSWAYMLLLAGKDKEAEREATATLKLGAQSADAHYVLGVVSLRANDYAKALEEAKAAVSLNPKLASAWLLKSQALLGGESAAGALFVKSEELETSRKARYREAADNLERYIQLSPDGTANIETWRDQLETLRFLGGLVDDGSPDRPVLGNQTTTRARILTRPEPTYTERARQAGVEGTVVLRAVLSADGTIKHILIVKGLEDGLTEQAVRAARGIKFIPAEKDGHPVSQYIQIEYNFSLHF